MIEMTHHVHHVLVLFGNDVVSLESRPLIFVYLCTSELDLTLLRAFLFFCSYKDNFNRANRL